MLRFDSKGEFDRYAGQYAQQPLDLYGELCKISVVLLPDHYGLLVKFHHTVGDAYMTAGGTKFLRIYYGKVRDALIAQGLWERPASERERTD